GDTLLPLRHKPVGKQREIHAVNPSAPRGSLHSGQLVFENGFGIVQQPPNRGTFAIIHAACGNETQQLTLIKLNPIHRSYSKLGVSRLPRTHEIERFCRQAGQKDLSCKAREEFASGGVLRRYVGASDSSATKQMSFFHQPVRNNLPSCAAPWRLLKSGHPCACRRSP